MKSITFTCEVVTPMFLAGADGKTLELRPPSIKGAMRFWWRAMHGNLPMDDRKDNEGNIIEKGLRTREAEIFGGGGENARRCPFSIRVRSDSTICSNEKPLPHHTGNKDCSYMKLSPTCRGNKDYNQDKCQKGRAQTSISGGIFSIELKGSELGPIKSLFVLTCLLGGFGKRSRRGFGSVKIVKRNGIPFSMPNDLESIRGYLLEFNDNYRLDDVSNRIYLHKPETLNGEYSEYPYIEEIQIGAEPYSKLSSSIDEEYPGFELVEFIGRTTHQYFDENKSNGAGKPRFASPTYVSALKVGCAEQLQNEEECFYPIITTLHYAPPNGITDNSGLKANFKNAILEKNLSDN